MNMEVFRLINNLAYKNKLLDNIMMFLSKDMIYIFGGILVLMFLSGILKKDKELRFNAVNTAFLTCINLMLGYIIGTIFYVDRPFVHNKVNLLYPHAEDASFPSDHATVTMSVALGISKYNKVFSIVLTVLSILVGFSRVYVGHHSPADIVGTYIIVIAISLIYNSILFDKVKRIYEKAEGYIITKLGIRI